MPQPRHPRLLYPLPSNTTECLTSCSAACLYYSLCPLPPLPSLPPPPPSTPIHLHHFPRLLLALLIPSAILVFLSLLFLFLCLFFAYCRRRRRVLNTAPAPVPFHLNPPEITPDSDQHYVWYIRTVGLDDSAIHAISARSYKSGDGGSGASMEGCTVCIGEFNEGELLRLLPKCGHAFHVSCIDTWLRAHASCPLCRAAVVAPSPSGFSMSPSPSDTEGDSSDSEILNLGDGRAQGNGESFSCTQPVRRSASMGSLACKGENSEEGSASNSKELKVCFGFEVELVRSWSCGGNRFFLSRHGRG
ncbi:RING-H2 finger protein ATL52-like protein [Carex littledalei]|uniref:RING-type E3 ubiquitin transferase n=1 Tax=Carex littledalei TaxID=544730 RepID=A0A833VFS1_9POAL|nr:RING-H2 finger protein ATL52-like protein [Carex littledalei]